MLKSKPLQFYLSVEFFVVGHAETSRLGPFVARTIIGSRQRTEQIIKNAIKYKVKKRNKIICHTNDNKKILNLDKKAYYLSKPRRSSLNQNEKDNQTTKHNCQLRVKIYLHLS